MVHNGDIFSGFSPDNIEKNVDNLREYYKEHVMHELDERSFLLESRKLQPSSSQSGFSSSSNSNTLIQVQSTVVPNRMTFTPFSR